MFCPNCGSTIPERSSFCPNCGTSIQTITEYKETGEKTNYRKIGIIVSFLVVLVAIILFCVLLGGKGYTKTLDKYFHAIEIQDAELMLSLAPDYWKDYMCDGWYMSEQDLIDMMEENINDELDEFMCGDDVKIHYKVLRTYKPSKSEINALEDNLYDEYAYYLYDRDDFNISDAILVYLRITVKGNNHTEQFTYPDGFLVFKENGKWRVLFGAVSTSWYSNL